MSETHGQNNGDSQKKLLLKTLQLLLRLICGVTEFDGKQRLSQTERLGFFNGQNKRILSDKNHGFLVRKNHLSNDASMHLKHSHTKSNSIH